jgi:predicted N-formylglutamate amidohydrolase
VLLFMLRPVDAGNGKTLLMNDNIFSLLAADEPDPVTVFNPSGRSPIIIVADHAGNRIPRALKLLGITATECQRHIAWDIGIAEVARLLAEALDATLIQQNYSRLVIDCNRLPGSETSIAQISELTPVPGNVGLSEDASTIRVQEIFQPYHRAIEAALDRRASRHSPTALVAMHSFTPVYKGVVRPWHAGVLYNRDPSFARLLMSLLKNETGFSIGDNEPYSVTDETDYTIPVHGERRGTHHVAIEIRQDLIIEAKGQEDWAALLTRVLSEAYNKLIAPKMST